MSLDKKKKKLTLLICDDVDLNREILRGVLGNRYNYKEASDGDWCIMELERSHEDIDVLILDLVMPHTNGIKVLEWLQEQTWPEKPIVVVMSTEDDNDIISKAFELGASDYISRPVNPILLENRINTHLDGMRAKAELQYEREYDSLTDLLKRFTAAERMQAVLDGPGADDYAVLKLDIDYLKNINDTRGHEFGDVVLREVGARIRTIMNPGDIAARLGGDEFLVFARLIESIDSFAVSLHDLLNFSFQGQMVSVSIGVVQCAQGDNADELLSKADDAMYYAKYRGRSQIAIFEERMKIHRRRISDCANGKALPVALIVEDSPLDAKILKHVLGRHYTIKVVEDGLAAKEEIIRNGDNIDFVILDLEIPKIHGMTLLDWLRESDRLRDMPVIVCTSLASVDMEVDCLRHGASGFITKPVHKEIAENRIMSCMKVWSSAGTKR